jgi:hypothetical protein
MEEAMREKSKMMNNLVESEDTRMGLKVELEGMKKEGSRS